MIYHIANAMMRHNLDNPDGKFEYMIDDLNKSSDVPGLGALCVE